MREYEIYLRDRLKASESYFLKIISEFDTIRELIINSPFSTDRIRSEVFKENSSCSLRYFTKILSRIDEDLYDKQKRKNAFVSDFVYIKEEARRHKGLTRQYLNLKNNGRLKTVGRSRRGFIDYKDYCNYFRLFFDYMELDSLLDDFDFDEPDAMDGAVETVSDKNNIAEGVVSSAKESIKSSDLHAENLDFVEEYDDNTRIFNDSLNTKPASYCSSVIAANNGKWDTVVGSDRKSTVEIVLIGASGNHWDVIEERFFVYSFVKKDNVLDFGIFVGEGGFIDGDLVGIIGKKDSLYKTGYYRFLGQELYIIEHFVFDSAQEYSQLIMRGKNNFKILLESKEGRV